MTSQDLDFDEIDRAVNGLAPNDASGDSVATSNAIQSTSVPLTQPSVPRPNVGRFMDVMHPSADMRTGHSAVAPTPVPPAPQPTPPAPVAVEPAAQFANPPTLTPFLPDANEKVEKRPLGGPAPQPDTSQNQVDMNSPQEVALGTPESVAEPASLPTPEEAIDNQSAVEAEQSDGHLGVDTTVQAPANTPAETIEQPTEAQRLQQIESQEVVEPVAVPAQEPTAQTDTQSNNQGVTDNNPAGAVPTANPQNSIYDVNQYHQPLQHPAKRKSGWLTVLIIVGIIALGAVLAAAAYFIFGIGG